MLRSIHGVIAGAGQKPVVGFLGYNLANAGGAGSPPPVAGSPIPSFHVNSQDGVPNDVTFKLDGTRMYMAGDTNNTIYQYDLGTAWDITTASFDGSPAASHSVSSEGIRPRAVRFNTDGTRMFVMDSGTFDVNQYLLSTAWDIRTAAYDNGSPEGVLNISVETTLPLGMEFNPDGTIMYITDGFTTEIYQYTLGTAWDITTASFNGSPGAYNITVDTVPSATIFRPDGKRAFVLGGGQLKLYQFSLAVAWDITTMSFDNVAVYLASLDTGPTGCAFNNDGTRTFFIGNTSDRVWELNTEV